MTYTLKSTKITYSHLSVNTSIIIVLEQNLLLNTPETVPFRLSRDLFDPVLGQSKKSVTDPGTFCTCLEETLRILRSNRSLLLQILEVIVHDPLF